MALILIFFAWTVNLALTLNFSKEKQYKTSYSTFSYKFKFKVVGAKLNTDSLNRQSKVTLKVDKTPSNLHLGLNFDLNRRL